MNGLSVCYYSVEVQTLNQPPKQLDSGLSPDEISAPIVRDQRINGWEIKQVVQSIHHQPAMHLL